MNIIQSIELCDLSEANARLREQTCEKVLKGLEEIKSGQMACNSVKEALIELQRGELEQKDITWWRNLRQQTDGQRFAPAMAGVRAGVMLGVGRSGGRSWMFARTSLATFLSC